MDAILLPFLQSTKESEREQYLSDLIFVHAAPLVRHTLRQRLGFYVNKDGANPHKHDAEDIYHDVITKLIQLLNDPQLASGKIEIKNFRQYVTRVATNACHDFLRSKSPARSRLKNSIRDMLDRHEDFSIWKSENDFLCGLASWHGKTKSSSSWNRLINLEERPEDFRSERFPQEDIKQASLVRMVAEVFRWIGGPVELDNLVSVIAILKDIKDYPVDSLDGESSLITQHITDSSFHCGSHLELREALNHLWEEIRQLPPKQRDTFCLSFEDENGDDLFSLLFDTGIVTLQELAQELGRSPEQLMKLWQQMPMDNANIADELGASRPQVSKWRFRALKQLQKRLILTMARK